MNHPLLQHTPLAVLCPVTPPGRAFLTRYYVSKIHTFSYPNIRGLTFQICNHLVTGPNLVPQLRL